MSQFLILVTSFFLIAIAAKKSGNGFLLSVYRTSPAICWLA